MEGAGVGGVWPAALGHDSGREEGKKEQGGPWGRSPAAARPEAVRGGLAMAASGQRAVESMGAALQSSSVARIWGERGREPRGLYCLPWFGLGCSGEGSSGVAGVLGRRQAAMVVVVPLRGSAATGSWGKRGGR